MTGRPFTKATIYEVGKVATSVTWFNSRLLSGNIFDNRVATTGNISAEAARPTMLEGVKMGSFGIFVWMEKRESIRRDAERGTRNACALGLLRRTNADD
jgi:hypothetical protein